MKKPCKNCPWKKSTRTEDIPGGGLDPRIGRRQRRMELGARMVMQCHLSPDDEPQACAGFVVQVGTESIALRLAVIRGIIDPEEFSAGEEELHPTYDAMLAAHNALE